MNLILKNEHKSGLLNALYQRAMSTSYQPMMAAAARRVECLIATHNREERTIVRRINPKADQDLHSRRWGDSL
ncbi:hypothetical protein [Vreelandella sp. V005]|uniref:hypothetical protein n=1 Tax=Vreelandella sp. V005 TaxID=3459608 RepID=UPI0040440D17